MGQISINKSPKKPNLALEAPKQPLEPSERIVYVDRVVEVEKPVERIVERVIEVQVPVEVQVPGPETIIYLDKPPIEIVKEVIVEKPVEIIKEIVVEKPVEVIKEVQKVVHIPRIKVKHVIPNWILVLVALETAFCLFLNYK